MYLERLTEGMELAKSSYPLRDTKIDCVLANFISVGNRPEFWAKPKNPEATMRVIVTSMVVEVSTTNNTTRFRTESGSVYEYTF